MEIQVIRGGIQKLCRQYSYLVTHDLGCFHCRVAAGVGASGRVGSQVRHGRVRVRLYVGDMVQRDAQHLGNQHALGGHGSISHIRGSGGKHDGPVLVHLDGDARDIRHEGEHGCSVGTAGHAHSYEVAALLLPGCLHLLFGLVPVDELPSADHAVLQAEVAKGFPVIAGRLKGIRQVLKEHVRRVQAQALGNLVHHGRYREKLLGGTKSPHGGSHRRIGIYRYSPAPHIAGL